MLGRVFRNSAYISSGKDGDYQILSYNSYRCLGIGVTYLLFRSCGESGWRARRQERKGQSKKESFPRPAAAKIWAEWSYRDIQPLFSLYTPWYHQYTTGMYKITLECLCLSSLNIEHIPTNLKIRLIQLNKAECMQRLKNRKPRSCDCQLSCSLIVVLSSPKLNRILESVGKALETAAKGHVGKESN